MILFFRHLPDKTLRSELIAIISPFIKGGLLQKKGRLGKVEILGLKDQNTKVIEHHALVKIEPDNVALRVIKKLHGKRFKSTRLSVRKYFLRNWHNDKRDGQNVPSASFVEKRSNSDRRRRLEVLSDVGLLMEDSSYQTLQAHIDKENSANSALNQKSDKAK